MGARNGPYNADFPEGTVVRIAPRSDLERFMTVWKLHNPLQPSQLAYAGVTAHVIHVHYYHGGDELYSLDCVPGLWHETCLRGIGAA
jgi:hypothetical protein